MALIKTQEEIKILKLGGQILSDVLRLLSQQVKPGTRTIDLEEFALKEIKKLGAEPAFKGYRTSGAQTAYPAALCTSVNDQIVHCIPSDLLLCDGDIVSLDLGIKYQGLFTDAAITLPVGTISAEIKKLLAGTSESLSAGIAQMKPGNTIGDVASAVQQVGRRYKFGIIRDLVGHGVGHSVHEPPSVPNYGRAGTLEVLRPGMVLAIEPMFTLGDWRIKFLDDGWGVVTADGSLSAHFEHTVAITEYGNVVLTE